MIRLVNVEGRAFALADSLAELGNRWTGLLLGNGASMALSPRFGYASLFATAIEQGFIEERDARTS